MSKKTGLALVMLFLLSGTALAEQVVVLGNNRVAKDFILAQFPRNGVHTAEEMDAGVKALFETGQFADIKVSKLKGGNPVITVKEAEIAGVVDLAGNKRLKDDVLSKMIDIKPGQPFSETGLAAAKTTILKAYAATGRNDATVTVKTAAVGERTNIQFVIDEGSKLKIAKIYFTGNDHLREAYLKSFISPKESGVLSTVMNRDVYDIDQLDRDRQKIIAFYQSKGYADVVISNADVTFDRESQEAMIGFHIEEGKLYKVSSISVESTVPSYPSADLKSQYRSAGFYDPQEIARIADEVDADLATRISGSTDLKVRTNRNSDGTIDVVYTVDQADNVYIERIEIVGNETTKDYVIRRELDFAEGDRIEPRQIRQAERRLKGLGFFESVQIKTLQSGKSDRAKMVVEVVEQKTGEFSIGGGYSTADGILATVGLSQSNFMGTGRGFAVEVGRGEDTDSYLLSLSEPYIFGYRATGFVDVYQRNYGFDDNRFHPYEETKTGGRIGVTAPITDDLSGSVYYGIYEREISDVPAEYQGFDGSPFLIDTGSDLVSFAGYELKYDTLDVRTNPSDGTYATFSQELAGLGGDVSWLKSEARVTVYSELMPREDVIGSLGLKAGNITSIGEDLAFVDHYRNNADLVRGFERGGFGPRDEATGYSLGGQFYLGGTAETTVPLPFVPEGLGLKGVLFVDAGSVFDPDKTSVAKAGSTTLYEDFSIRASTGAGISWDSPVGLIKANVAVPLAKEDQDRLQWFSFSAGSRF